MGTALTTRAYNVLFVLLTVGVSCLCSGCSNNKTPLDRSSGNVAPSKASHDASQNDRIKMITLPDRAIDLHKRVVVVSGIWLPETKDKSDAVGFPQQAEITCFNEPSRALCTELDVTLVQSGQTVAIGQLAQTSYDVSIWDEGGLVANVTDECHMHVLTMAFQSGTVSISDIPTHKDDCAAFLKTNSYRLARGNYWIDTSPNNDFDKPKPTGSK